MSASASRERTAGGGVGFTGALFLLFLGLKLAGFIDWSWWWVTAPLWVPLALTVVLCALFLAVVTFLAMVDTVFDR